MSPALKRYARRAAGLEMPSGTYNPGRTPARWTPAEDEARALQRCGYRPGSPQDFMRCFTLEHCEALEGVPVGSTYFELEKDRQE